MSYQKAISYLYALEKKGVRLSLGRIRKGLRLRGHPERGLRFVHIAGTNGKGSTAAMVEAILRAAGFRTGLFTSPHLHRFPERIRINGKPLAQSKVAEYLAPIRSALDKTGLNDLSFYETTTLLAFETFAREQCDIVVLEVGLGGRLDATNVIRPEVSVITQISKDHTRILGNTLSAIAGEKAGIIKHRVPVVSGVRRAAARRTVRDVAESRSSVLYELGRDFRIIDHPDANRLTVSIGDDVYPALEPGLLGKHQQHNAALAVMTAHLLGNKRWFQQGGAHSLPAAISKGLKGARWPGRLEWVAGSPPVLLDAAHNKASAEALASYLKARRNRPKRALVFGAMADKDLGPMLQVLAAEVEAVFFVSANMRRSATTEQLHKLHPGTEAKNTAHALRLAQKAAGKRGEVVVCGSIFVMAEARGLLLNEACDPLIAM